MHTNFSEEHSERCRESSSACLPCKLTAHLNINPDLLASPRPLPPSPPPPECTFGHTRDTILQVPYKARGRHSLGPHPTLCLWLPSSFSLYTWTYESDPSLLFPTPSHTPEDDFNFSLQSPTWTSAMLPHISLFRSLLQTHSMPSAKSRSEHILIGFKSPMASADLQTKYGGHVATCTPDLTCLY